MSSTEYDYDDYNDYDADEDGWLDDDWLERDDEAIRSMEEQEEQERLENYVDFLEHYRAAFDVISKSGLTIAEKEFILKSENYEEYKWMFLDSPAGMYSSLKNKEEYTLLKNIFQPLKIDDELLEETDDERGVEDNEG